MKNSIPLVDEMQLTEIDTISNKPHMNGVLIFKHSTRCGVSRQALNNLTREWSFKDEELPVYYLDLIKHRTLSNRIAEKYQIRHESPQLLFIKSGTCTGNASHSDASIKAIESWING
jgi:bacillithiol system protein YtxJ